METNELIAKAAAELQNKGYSIAFTMPRRGVDLIVFEKDNPDKAIFVAVRDGSDRRSIPKEDLGKNHRDIARASALKRGTAAWVKEVEWKGTTQYDAVWVTKKSITHVKDILK